MKTIYYGLFLSDNDSKVIRSFIPADIMSGGKETKNDHITILYVGGKEVSQEHKAIEDFCKRNLGSKFRIRISRYGKSDKALAFKAEILDDSVPTVNRVTHITIATFGNGKPVDSNKIENWNYELENSVYLTTELRVVQFP